MKSKTLFALWGNAGQGKSTAIKAISEEIQKQYPQAIVQIFSDRVDIKLIIKIRKIKIGIESQGDPGSRLPKSLDFFRKENCDIIICATRTSGGTVKAVENMADKYDVIWISNYISNERNKKTLNHLFAQSILKLIRHYYPTLKN